MKLPLRLGWLRLGSHSRGRELLERDLLGARRQRHHGREHRARGDQLGRGPERRAGRARRRLPAPVDARAHEVRGAGEQHAVAREAERRIVGAEVEQHAAAEVLRPLLGDRADLVEHLRRELAAHRREQARPAVRHDLDEQRGVVDVGRDVDAGHRAREPARALDLVDDLAHQLRQLGRRLDRRLIGELRQQPVVAGDDRLRVAVDHEVGVGHRVLQRRVGRRRLRVGLQAEAREPEQQRDHLDDSW